jgi:hypothetical protein
MPHIEGSKYACRNEHPTYGGCEREGSPTQLAELTVVDLATDLEANHEKKDRHEPVVDPEVQITLEGE